MTLLHGLIDDAEAMWPDRIAVSTRSEALTHAQLAAASRRITVWLKALGLRRGQRVVYVGPTDVVVPALIYAASRLGAPFSLLHELTRGEALAHVLTDAEPSLLISHEIEARELATAHGIPAADLDTLRDHALSTRDASIAPAASVLSIDPVCLIYTSGTTSRPKAVVSTHDQATFAIRAIQSVLDYRQDDIVYCPLPLSFDYGMYQLFLGAASGAQVRLGLPAEVGPSLLNNLIESGATILASVPAVAENLARLLRRSSTRAPHALRLLTNTGAAMPSEPLAALRDALPGLRVQLMFGLTECKRAAIMPVDADLERPGACGIALPGTEIFAIDAEGRRLAPGEIGELVVRGPNVMAGYWRAPEQTARRFPRGEGLFPQLNTGDHGRVDADGYVYFVGRVDDIYKERGFRISTIEVETAARRVPGVESAVVLPPRDGEPALLVVVGDLDPESVTLHMRDLIEVFKIPQRCVVLDALPLTHNGKIDRKALRAEVAHG